MWRSVNDRYEVSETGDVRNSKTLRVLKPFKLGKYHGVWVGAQFPKAYIHRLVAGAFLPAPTGSCVVDHIDRNKFNNAASNLRWASPSDNSRNRTIELKARRNNTNGHHHIKFIRTKTGSVVYAVAIDSHLWGRHTGKFKTLEEAVVFRDSITKRCTG